MSRTDIRWAMASAIADRLILLGAIAVIVWMALGGAA